METSQVRYFLALCEERNFSRAASRCGITQPSLTNAIRKLERELGGPLFIRKPRIEPTDLGHVVLPYLKEIARNIQGAREAARSRSRAPTPPADCLTMGGA